MRLRYGLQARFLTGMTAVLVLTLLLLGLLWQRQTAMQREVESISREVLDAMVRQSVERRGTATANQLARTLANPLYYFDLDAIGDQTRSAMRQPGIAYVLVYDADGNIIHDGTEDIGRFGQIMADPLASRVMAAREPAVVWTDRVMDASAPIMIGSQRIGGVRLGLDLASARRTQEDALLGLRTRLDAMARRQLGWIVVLGLVLFAAAAAALLLVQRFVVRPIRELASAAGEIEAGRYDTDTPASVRHDEIGELVRGFRRMRDSIARHDREIRHIAYTDALTGLPNRTAFRDVLEARMEEARKGGADLQIALLFADVDDFKRVNDTLGHDAGDEVLLQCANRIRNAVDRHGGDRAMLARFGGDEFVVMLEGVELRQTAAQLGAALVRALAEPIAVEGRQLFLGTSVGITLYPDDARDAAVLMKNGDIAMYQAKIAGKNCHRFYNATMNQAMERRVYLEHDLRGAWNRGELSLAYQPIYRLSDGALVGAETLLRWLHPELGLVAPAAFIDVAEQSGVIETLGPLVLDAACRDAARWQAVAGEAGPLFLSVNVSPRQLRTGDLASLIGQSLADTGLAPALLHIELTETAVLGDEAHVSRLLERIRELGVKVWLDDFGTGFSGLSHLRRVPVDGVKIDRSFIADILHDTDDLALTGAIISMAHSLGIVVVAEGVEKEGQYAVLRERGCDLAQGFWLGPPVGAEQFLKLLDPAEA
ncbi:putative bifunctional diguanylate cyclase/phosphodiesterase [Vulcaniibacterium thermophilum]|uniref:GGDEF domain-containing protein n=1 Tax=Vulcaniibacterium thermophilum TaxID=1169913 RepID=A0A919D8N8_9GAMM|nr:EAL domain-containing protein [Vulcaniibacterium thermophilum]GHE25228.1 GGDEF domain-containing protein [Vulcaniibacterium thermophilum]